MNDMKFSQFTGKNQKTRASKILCGPTSALIGVSLLWGLLIARIDSVVIDRMDMYYMAGKWKLTGDGKCNVLSSHLSLAEYEMQVPLDNHIPLSSE